MCTAREDRDTVVSDHAWLAQIARPTTFAPPCKGMLLLTIRTRFACRRAVGVYTGFQSPGSSRGAEKGQKITPLPAWAPLLRDTRHAPRRCRIYVERGIVRYGITYRIRRRHTKNCRDRVTDPSSDRANETKKRTPKPETRCRYSTACSHTRFLLRTVYLEPGNHDGRCTMYDAQNGNAT